MRVEARTGGGAGARVGRDERRLGQRQGCLLHLELLIDPLQEPVAAVQGLPQAAAVAVLRGAALPQSIEGGSPPCRHALLLNPVYSTT